ncbi:hypothetical protein [Saccharolobus caldissimus]|uniref:Uncharacterized protein n=1 Tax=Saccharolobus caldissimus TaxID=1702097 RepID=A0AAQ4CRW1_9CREN|nr:hypothetical protein [Saccharolobus caldissimus]BDB98542.1 hypothetical protein SACC_15590 [Saccharolobus caldissimus]
MNQKVVETKGGWKAIFSISIEKVWGDEGDAFYIVSPYLKEQISIDISDAEYILDEIKRLNSALMHAERSKTKSAISEEILSKLMKLIVIYVNEVVESKRHS